MAADGGTPTGQLRMMAYLEGCRHGDRKFPWGTERIVGWLSYDREGFSWTPLLRWRHPRLVEVRWADLRQIDTVSGLGTFCIVDGWDGLMIAPWSSRLFDEALRSAGFMSYKSPAWPGRTIVLPTGWKPDWSQAARGVEFVGIRSCDANGS